MSDESVYELFPVVYDAITFTDQRDADADVTAVCSAISNTDTPDDGVILDVGCGTATHLTTFPDSYTRVGVDISKPMLTYAVEEHNSPPHIATGDMHSLPVQDSSVDVITCLYSTINYISSRDVLDDVVSEWKRVLTDSGVIFIEFTPCSQENAVNGVTSHNTFTVETESHLITALQSSEIINDTLELTTAYTVTEYDTKFTQFTDTEQLTLLGPDTVTDAFNTHGFDTSLREDILPLHTLIASRN